MNKFTLIFIILLFFFVNLLNANDRIINDSNHCMKYFSQYERSHNIPNNLLKAVSLTESGIYHPHKKQTLTWPWTINYRGKGYYFKTKNDAVKAVRMIVKSGDKMVDVGCMQINLHYHPEAFDNIDQAFDPIYNIAYAAKFLKNHYNRSGNWNNAVAAYHSENYDKGKLYLARVLKNWQSNSTISPLKYTNLVTTSVNKAKPKVKNTKLNNKPIKKDYERYKQGKLLIQVTSYNGSSMSPNNEVSNISRQLIKNYHNQVK